MKKARLADGRVLKFPSSMDNNSIQAAVKNYLGKAKSELNLSNIMADHETAMEEERSKSSSLAADLEKAKSLNQNIPVLEKKLQEAVANLEAERDRSKEIKKRYSSEQKDRSVNIEIKTRHLESLQAIGNFMPDLLGKLDALTSNIDALNRNSAKTSKAILSIGEQIASALLTPKELVKTERGTITGIQPVDEKQETLN